MPAESLTHECPRCSDVHLPKEQEPNPFGPHLPDHRLGSISDVWGTWCMDCHGWLARIALEARDE